MQAFTTRDVSPDQKLTNWYPKPLAPKTRADRDLSVLKNMLEAGDVLPALGVLNRHAPYRFTAINRFDSGVQHTLFIFDRLGAGQLPLPSLEMKDTFCQYITPTQPFCVFSAAVDSRLTNHKYRDVIASYYGTALCCADEKLLSSLCHFDFQPRATLRPEECAFLEQAKALFSGVLH